MKRQPVQEESLNQVNTEESFVCILQKVKGWYELTRAKLEKIEIIVSLKETFKDKIMQFHEDN